MSNLFSALKTAAEKASTSTSTSESIEITVSSLSAPINGKFGPYRQFKLSDGTTLNVDDARITNVNVFKPNSKATLTMNQYVNKDGVEKTVISQLCIELPTASGLFIMR
jgi:hypothetical protein